MSSHGIPDDDGTPPMLIPVVDDDEDQDHGANEHKKKEGKDFLKGSGTTESSYCPLTISAVTTKEETTTSKSCCSKLMNCYSCFLLAILPKWQTMLRSSSNGGDSDKKLTSVVEKVLKSYVKFLASSFNQDKGLKFLQYTLWLASKFYSKDSHGCKGLTKLSSEILMARYVTRLLQFPTAVEAALYKSWTITPSPEYYPKTFQLLGDLLAWSMILYYPTEHLAYLQWQVPDWLGSRTYKRSANRWSAWSCRGWVVYILAEMVQGLLQRKQLLLLRQQQQQQQLRDTDTKDQQQQAGDTAAASLLEAETNDKRSKAAKAAELRAKALAVASSKCHPAQSESDAAAANKNMNSPATAAAVAAATAVAAKTEQDPKQRQLQQVQLQLARNALFLLPAIHYSMPNWDIQPWLPSDVVNMLFWLESVVCLYQSSV